MSLSTPHELMTYYDQVGSSYVVSFNFLGSPPVKNADVLTHGPDWVRVRTDADGERFVNLRLVASFAVLEV